MSRRWLTLLFCLGLWLQCARAAPPGIPPDPDRVEWKDVTVSLFRRPDYRTFADAVLDKDLNYFHWTIDVSPQHTGGQYVDSFDVSNGVQVRQGPKENIETNLARPGATSPDFRFQYKYNVEPAKAVTLQARIKIGSAEVSTIDVLKALQELDMPGPGESCVAWAQLAVRSLQRGEVVREFHVETFFEKALEYGFERCRVVQDPNIPVERIPHENMVIAELGQDGDIVKPESSYADASTPRQGKKPHPHERGKKRPCTILKRELCDDLETVAEQGSRESFDSLLERYGHESLAKPQGRLHLELRSRMQAFREVPRFERITALAERLGSKALVVGGLALYVAAVAETFSSDASVLDKAAVVTSILPFIGCAVRAADDAVRGHLDTVAMDLCFLEDGLTLCGFWEVALLLQAVESIYKLSQQMEEQQRLYDTDYFLDHRMVGWENKITDLGQYIDSPEFMYNATNLYSAYQVGVLFQASQLMGDLKASRGLAHASAHSNSTTNGTNVAVVKDGWNEHIDAATQDEIDRQLCAEAARNKVRTQKLLESQMLDAVKKLSERYDEAYTERYVKEATKPIELLGFIPLHASYESPQQLRDELDRLRRHFPLQLYEERIKVAIERVIGRIKTPPLCARLKQGDLCEDRSCASPPSHIDNVKICSQARERQPCAEIPAPRNQCVDMPYLWRDLARSINLKKALGTCAFYVAVALAATSQHLLQVWIFIVMPSSRTLTIG
ncbi:uncharacterized protein MAM_05949 [Metarhizium album ARSEF 1941]|uniref:Heat Labile Enterotoxin Type Iib n=1 Tax=Metarhizium album (strain ARSEF 1941) TaxID=1081103 RepID=A0A0B2WJ81_METAS|nr:uncharacterized protein MAM_05949 [Metarhizium album ARSEF 1941]KHN96101.1 hypothetical protein MAM_05949 [Metarhizium album ARSEF 1941]